MLRLEHIYWLAALLLGSAVVIDLRARRWAHAAFWLLLALMFAGGDAVLAAARTGQRLPQQAVGAGVVVLALLAAFGLRRDGPAARAGDRGDARPGHRLFLPALLIPVLTAGLVLAAPHLRWGDTPLLPREQVTLGALALACALSTVAALRVTRARAVAALRENHRLLDTIGWAAVLPMLLAALGNVFAATGVGEDGYARAMALIEAECDVIMVDTAHGHSRGVLDTIARIKKASNYTQVAGGNVAAPAEEKGG